MFGSLRFLPLLLAIAVQFGGIAAHAMTVDHLQCEYRLNPQGVDVPQPRLSWELNSNGHGEIQTAYQVLVSSTAEQLDKDRCDLWDSGQLKSDQNILISYAGKPLLTGQQAFWKVRSWDKAGEASAWSVSAAWTMGILNETDWKAKWITADGADSPGKYPTLLLRREFQIRPGLRRAVVFVCGLGYYEMSINGAKIGDDLLSPGWTKYNKTCLYDTRDITTSLRPGANAIGLFLGNGMYNAIAAPGRYTKFKGSFGPQKAIAQLLLEYQDGSTDWITTDGQWRAAPGPITFTSPYGGEDFDARLVLKNWNLTGFDDSKWSPALMTTGPGGTLKCLSCAAPPIRSFDVFQPVKITEIRPGVTTYDFGQNAAQIPAITVKGSAGSTIKLWPSELLRPDGAVDQSSTGKPIYLLYTLAGTGSETWSPKFFYSGYRYLQVERTPPPSGGELPVLDAIQSQVVHTSSPPVGDFATSSELFNRIYTLVRWAQRSNMVSVLTDCPHREKLGWLEQDHLNGLALRYNFDLNAFFSKTMNDMADSQLADGLIPTTAPEYTIFPAAFRDSPEWGSAFLLVAWQQYQFTGDIDLFRRHFDAMQRYVAYLGSKAVDNIVSTGLSDWYDIAPGHPGKSKLTPLGLTATAFYYQDAIILAGAAKQLGRTDDAIKYETLAEQIRKSFNAKFFNPATNQYAGGSQCANSIPLVMDIVDPPDRQAVLENIVQDVQKKGLTAGDVGYRYLLRALADGGRSDVIYAMNNQSDKPGYGYQLKMGATSLTEAWDALRTSSQNHFMLGQINEWFYHDLAGIQNDPESPGFKKIIIKPAIVGDLTFVRATYHSVRGEIRSEWKRQVRHLTLNITIPANTSATIFIPTTDPKSVNGAGDAMYLRREGNSALYSVGSGNYEFTAELPDSFSNQKNP